MLSEKLTFDSSDRYQKISDLVMHAIEGL
jgi:hypothetical protein